MGLNSSTKVETNLYKLEISVDGATFAEAVKQSYRKNVKKLNVPGFRKGKAPQHMCEKLFGEGIFFEDAIDMVMPTAYALALQEADLDVVSRPEIDLVSVSKEEGLVFTASVYVKPEVSLKEYKGIKVTKSVNTVGVAKVKEELENMRERNARILTVTDAPAKMGDTTMLNFKGFLDGVAFEGGEGEGYPLVLGSGTFIPGFEEQVAGHGLNEEFDVNVTFPENYGSAELAGKPVVFKCTITEIKSRELPELDDEFAKDVSEFDTLDELKKDIKKRLQETEEKVADTAVEDAILDAVVEGLEAEIPEAMFENKIDEMVSDFDYRLSSQGMSLDLYMQYTGMTMEKFRESFKEGAEKQVKMRLALEKIVELENIEVSDEEVEAELERMSSVYNMEVEQIKSMVPTEAIKGDLAANKAIDFVKANAEITKEKVPVKKAAAKKAE